MTGDDRRRFCSRCRRRVHEVRRMTADEAVALLREVGRGRVCARLHRRADGTVRTRDCPFGRRRRLRRAFARAAALWLCLWGGLAACMRSRGDTPAPVPPTDAPATSPPDQAPLMGEIAVPPAPGGPEGLSAGAVLGDVEVEGPSSHAATTTGAETGPELGRVRPGPR